MPPEIWNQVAAAGLPCLLLSVAVWWLQRSNAEFHAENRTQWEKRFEMLNSHYKECDTDRKKLRKQLDDLTERFNKHLKDVFSGGQDAEPTA